jgi:hypothetical protein
MDDDRESEVPDGKSNVLEASNTAATISGQQEELTEAEGLAIRARLQKGKQSKRKSTATKRNIARKTGLEGALDRSNNVDKTRKDLMDYLALMREQPAGSTYAKHRIAVINKALTLLDRER